MNISTRRFFCLPPGVLLLLRSRCAAHPLVCNEGLFADPVCDKYDATEAARFCDSFSFNGMAPLLSV